MFLFEVEQELVFTHQKFLESFNCLADCLAKLESATEENSRRFYQTQVHYDKISLEYWAGQITYLQNLLSQKRRATIQPAALPRSRKKVIASTLKASKVA